MLYVIRNKEHNYLQSLARNEGDHKWTNEKLDAQGFTSLRRAYLCIDAHNLIGCLCVPCK